MKKVMLLGANGLVGSMLLRCLTSAYKYDIISISRKKTPLVDYSIDVGSERPKLKRLIAKVKPDIIINATGVLIAEAAKCERYALWINTVFPRWLEDVTKDTKTKCIFLSSDCVFNGKKGDYKDTDTPNETTAYGRTKGLGEIDNDKDLTIRKSLIGPEMVGEGTGLFAWFLRQKGAVKGYSKAMWNGMTSLCFANNLEKMIESDITGLYQLAPDYTISKYDLLKLIKKIWKLDDITVVEDKSVVLDKTLVCSYRPNFTPIFPKSYEEMIQELYNYKIILDNYGWGTDE